MDIAPIPSSTIWKKKGISNTSSDASRRTIKEMGNIEVCEPGETVKTTQCPSCFKYSKEGTVYCLCGTCHMHSPEPTEKIKNRIGIISNPLHIIKKVNQENVMHHTLVVRSLESKRYNNSSEKEKLSVIQMAHWSVIPSIAIDARIDSWVLQVLGLPQNRQHGQYCYLGWTRSIP